MLELCPSPILVLIGCNAKICRELEGDAIRTKRRGDFPKNNASQF
jgi:hypothetical protein